jgi:flagellar biosynthesis protein FlhG
MAPDPKTAKEMYTRLYAACDHFLSGVSLDLLGYIPRDPEVRKAVVNQRPFCANPQGGPACTAVQQVAKTIQNWEVSANLDGNIKFFWKKLLFRQ